MNLGRPQVPTLCAAGFEELPTGINGDVVGMDGDGRRHHRGVLATVPGGPEAIRT